MTKLSTYDTYLLHIRTTTPTVEIDSSLKLIVIAYCRLQEVLCEWDGYFGMSSNTRYYYTSTLSSEDLILLPVCLNSL
jgi:hypothetical protein